MTTSNDVAIYEGGQLDAYRPQIMTPEAAAELNRQLMACQRAVLQEGTDYGKLPGTNGKDVLFKPGAEKLLQWFAMSYSCERLDIEHDDDGRKEGVTYRATVLKRLPDGSLQSVATCDGYAGYDEEKFYQSTEAAQLKAEAKERHFASIDGRPANPNKWKNLTGEYRAPWNTVIKMAQKRAIVGAVINATAAGGLFTTDDDSDQAPADGRPSWYQQALGEALAITTAEAGRELFRASAQAVISGAITPNQATHIQNRIKQRVKQLSTHIQADVEDLTPASEDASPADKTAPAAPQSPLRQQGDGPAGEVPERPPAKITSGQQKLLDGHRQRLGYDDSAEDWDQWLADLAALAGLDTPIGAPAQLTQAEAKRADDQLKGLDAKALRKLLDNGEMPDGH